jgi:hypothetical protein
VPHHSTFFQSEAVLFANAPHRRTLHPATLSAVQKKIKLIVFYGHVLAVSSFSSPPFRSGVSFIPLLFIHYTTLLHFVYVHFTTSAPHGKSNSFSAFRKATALAFRVMAFAYPRCNGFCVLIIYKSRQCF